MLPTRACLHDYDGRAVPLISAVGLRRIGRDFVNGNAQLIDLMTDGRIFSELRAAPEAFAPSVPPARLIVGTSRACIAPLFVMGNEILDRVLHRAANHARPGRIAVDHRLHKILRFFERDMRRQCWDFRISQRFVDNRTIRRHARSHAGPTFSGWSTRIPRRPRSSEQTRN